MSKACKKGVSVLLIVALALCICIQPAAAAAAEFKTTQQFLDFLDEKDIRYSYIGVDGKSEQVNVSFSLDNFDSARCSIFFKNDFEEVSLRIWDIVKVSAGKTFTLSTINSLNKDFKFVAFVFDESDSTVQAELDMYIDPDHCARSVYDAMMIMFQIIDDDGVAEKLHSLE